MACNCGEKPTQHRPVTVDVVDDSGERFTGILYSSFNDFMQWFTSSVADFHLLTHSLKILNVSGKYSAHSLPMMSITKVEGEEEADTQTFNINLKKGNAYAYQTSSDRMWELGVLGYRKIESNKVDNVS